jgi:hypothetical protein
MDGGQAMQHVAHRPSDEIHHLRAENGRLRELIRVLLENDPNDDAADGVSVLDVWRKEAHRMLDVEQIGVDDLGNEWFRTVDSVT